MQCDKYHCRTHSGREESMPGGAGGTSNPCLQGGGCMLKKALKRK